MIRLGCLVLLLLPACMTPRIKKAHDEGYAAGVNEQKSSNMAQLAAIEESNRDLKFALAECNERLREWMNIRRNE